MFPGDEIDLAAILEHSLLDPLLNEDDLRAGCELAAHHAVAAVCIKPYAVQAAARWLAGANVTVATVVGWPHGSQDTPVKVFETEMALLSGAGEIELALNIGRVRDANWLSVANEIAAVVEHVRMQDAVFKLHVDTGLVPQSAYGDVCRICQDVEVETITCPVNRNEIEAGIDRQLLDAVVNAGLRLHVNGPVDSLRQMQMLSDLGIRRVRTVATQQILADARERRL